jgi:hypothetical protein
MILSLLEFVIFALFRNEASVYPLDLTLLNGVRINELRKKSIIKEVKDRSTLLPFPLVLTGAFKRHACAVATPLRSITGRSDISVSK